MLWRFFAICGYLSLGLLCSSMWWWLISLTPVEPFLTEKVGSEIYHLLFIVFGVGVGIDTMVQDSNNKQEDI